MDYRTLKSAFIVTIPVLLGYLAIGVAFGLLLETAGYPWFIAPVMSILIYAGAAQYIAVGLFSSSAGLLDVAIVTLLVNARHMVYGLSLLGKFKKTGPYKPYLVFALTDETYALLTSVKPPPDVQPTRFYFAVSILDQSYWVIGSIIGALLGSLVHFNTKGLDFALTALFIVLLIEQTRAVPRVLPYSTALTCGILALIFFPQNMLIAAIAASVSVLLIARGVFNYDARA